MNAPELGPVKWKKSSKSSGNGQCLRWADLGDKVAVGDTKDPDGAVLIFTPGEWTAFVEGVKLGEGDV